MQFKPSKKNHHGTSLKKNYLKILLVLIIILSVHSLFVEYSALQEKFVSKQSLITNDERCNQGPSCNNNIRSNQIVQNYQSNNEYADQQQSYAYEFDIARFNEYVIGQKIVTRLQNSSHDLISRKHLNVLLLGQADIIRRDSPILDVFGNELNLTLVKQANVYAFLEDKLNSEEEIHFLKLKYRPSQDGRKNFALKRMLPYFDSILCLSLKTSECLVDVDFRSIDEFYNLHGSPKINRLFDLRNVLWSKDKLCDMLGSKLDEEWISLISFPCYVLPRDYQLIRTQMIEESKENIKQSYIFKPFKQGGGKGIFLVHNITELEILGEENSYHFVASKSLDSDIIEIPSLFQLLKEKKENPKVAKEVIDTVKISKKKKFVVQPYLSSYFKIDKDIEKWDIRAYVLVSNLFPLRAYLYDRGLVRFTSKNSNGKINKKKFLTNTSVNRKFDGVEKVTLTFEQLKQKTSPLILQKMQRIIGYFLFTAAQAFKDNIESKTRLPKTFTCSSCYHLLGIDIIFDDLLNPRIIEVNGEPSMKLSKTFRKNSTRKQNHYDKTKLSLQKDIFDLLYSEPSNKYQEARKQLIQELDHSEKYEIQRKVFLQTIINETVEEDWKLGVTQFRKVWPNFEICFDDKVKQSTDRLIEMLMLTPESKLTNNILSEVNCKRVKLCITKNLFCDNSILEALNSINR